MISNRYAFPAALLLCVALVPTVIHSYLGATLDDGRHTSAIAASLAGLGFRPTNRHDKWGKDVYDSDDWIERRYAGPDGKEVLLFAARSYNLKRLYHHPELGVLRGVDMGRATASTMPGSDGKPIHVLRARVGAGLAAYVLLYDGRFVENPIALQLRTSWELIFSPRKPMTLFLVFDKNERPDISLEDASVVQVLNEAIRSFLSQPAKI